MATQRSLGSCRTKSARRAILRPANRVVQLRRVAVTGVGLICSVGHTTDEVWKAVLEGKSGVGPITLFDSSQFATKIAAEVKGFDPGRYVCRKDLKKMARFI